MKPPPRVYIFKISPQTHVRATQGDRILFRIPEARRSEAGTKRVRRLEKYNRYKEDLCALGKELQFELPMWGAAIRFFIPMPRTWRKWQKKQNMYQYHQSKPDLSNLLKAFEDALFAEDKAIAHYSEVSKHWVDGEFGWIEVIVRKPIACIFNNPYTEQVENSLI
jgi:Holliday junction resolvase RusA-like endonuclease